MAAAMMRVVREGGAAAKKGAFVTPVPSVTRAVASVVLACAFFMSDIFRPTPAQRSPFARTAGEFISGAVFGTGFGRYC